MSSSFTTRRVNKSTFVVQEHDAYGELPLIFVKVHPTIPVVIVSDTGCDEPNKKHKDDHYIHLRHYLENYPISCNGNSPLNNGGEKRYLIICTHCHFDHTGGIMQFLRGGTTEILASAAGRDFIESDLATHGLFNAIHRPAPYYHVTHWAQAFERLQWPFKHPSRTIATQVEKQQDLGITIFQTIGHTPDELSWYDHDEMHLYVGDSFYREGKETMPIIFTVDGNMIEWIFAMQKLAVFVRTENAKAAAAAEKAETSDKDGWVEVPRRVLVSCAHQTVAVDGAEILAELEQFSYRVISGDVPLVDSRDVFGTRFDTWRETTKERTPMSIMAPWALMEQVREFFGHPK
ncbi:hypothetical protein KC340_g13649 [Hortaea werneckii]|nr:hypothetical protein KC342_g13921 [Hortaea werneckii]KAI7098709.1 hypothetical protein KC339_g8747 [Hortaea werneckii]KAI7223282.1 hypothetical protein KC365_g11166 [Hortaea werneckii]KAI7299773.1 hypothetical protein KC340_g13649 [Hortaea werneckii]KAI7384970.1 hypothetical protein KC328_g10538 [Hortaea werneckii]